MLFPLEIFEDPSDPVPAADADPVEEQQELTDNNNLDDEPQDPDPTLLQSPNAVAATSALAEGGEDVRSRRGRLVRTPAHLRDFICTCIISH